MDRALLFIHIPKTAGTSFRLAALKYFGEGNTFFDYGRQEENTSEIIKKIVYEEEDFYAFYNNINSLGKTFLSGHFMFNKYGRLFETLNTITFVREPISQVLSHYNHFKKYNNYIKSFHSFIKEKRFQNIQSQYIGGKPLELYGFIGLSEEYDKSIEMINDYYDIELEVLQANINKDINKDILDDETVLLIKQYNAADIKMYEKAKNIFDNRLKCFENNEIYTHLLIQEKNEKLIRGSAFNKNFKQTIKVEILENNRFLKELEAKDFRPGLLVHGLPRKGFVGFEYRVEGDINIDINNISFSIKY